ncbi:TetR/AcrR family transcriptional regulator [Haliscomenobacter hydrossis]|uniref:Regulatory protein TetR n=1 Tax=Haliscomenobacter hydrossis (strain ATCC 27775 / DSM 1100 / LMG 10767 / O) TaxID=760192 RepID=F4KS58_HALH1|nr:TetR/AcrR family transcriptional regulator [Haliscomenobacter hydrossis]AEE52303.1 regulatory protein TetR [Haliscomenobacter hydrossis DSM 1100]
MALKPTKQRIIDAAITLYNTQGVSNTTLKHIAESVGMSIGNLAYHYPNHDYIIEEVYRQLEIDRLQVFKDMMEAPTFENINVQLDSLIDLAQKYLFIQLDGPYIMRNYPVLAELQRQFYENSMNFVKMAINMAVELGNIVQEQLPEQYQRLSHVIWMLVTFWCVQHALREHKKVDVEEVRQCIWSLIMPILTPKGKHLFNKISEANKLS